MSTIEDSIQKIRERIAGACARAGRTERDVRLVAVTKRVDAERIHRAVSLGIRDFGENYIQEAMKKIEGFGEDVSVSWHMIGHIQSNKLKYIPPLFSYIHSIDRWEILQGLERYGKPIKFLFELNLSGEASKHGTQEDNLRRMVEKVHTLKYMEPVGLMTMPPYVDNPEEVRGIFRSLREILERVNREFSLTMRELSMGMSSDFEVAIEEGATMVRIGTAIFGERQ
ncbi:MAG: YggS family pyridoxal phosphate-dependent enzyme [Syntrophorhabdus aromaticivorans]|uniref:Pyridoxal phosphate homeostasis protein n=1 Tax=Syntrophorhabdus aromaticivorans TaxID=328301 RepID=A0A971M311_9BACT|nr:YggS family pyridoxal phosphate-dependent enzyme [Syntrophorhabdus aromaticivorans]